MHWGVDSYGPADRNVALPEALRRAGDDDATATLFDFVERRMGRAPAFWGRYLNRRLPEDRSTHAVRSPEHSHSITPREADFLHARGCRVLLVYNGSAGRRERLRGGWSAGRDAAERADVICDQLGVPPHVAIYADVENWAGDVGWFRGWVETMRAAHRACGVYGRPTRLVENPADPSPTYGTPLDRIPSRFTRREATRMIERETTTTGVAPRRVMVREYWSDELRDALVGAADPFYVWSSEPRRVLSERSDAALDGADIPTEFVPAEPPGTASARTVVWQYLENALFLGGVHGTVDMNMATPSGLACMW